MAKSLSITIHPSALDGEYLPVSDAMQQVLDIVSTLEQIEDVRGAARRIVWRLTEAHTNSPPFTLTTEAYAVDPVVLINLEAERLLSQFGEGVERLLEGTLPPWFEHGPAGPLKRVFKRNLERVGRTDLSAGTDVISITPGPAKTAIAAIEANELGAEAAKVDLRRTEFGTAELIVAGLIEWNGKPSLATIDRLSGQKVTCVLADDLAKRLGSEHRWAEVWEHKRVLATGALQYGQDGLIKRVDAADVEELPFTDVPLESLREIDVLEGRTVSEHLRLVRGN